jgi:hypothetical protein
LKADNFNSIILKLYSWRIEFASTSQIAGENESKNSGTAGPFLCVV